MVKHLKKKRNKHLTKRKLKAKGVMDWILNLFKPKLHNYNNSVISAPIINNQSQQPHKWNLPPVHKLSPEQQHLRDAWKQNSKQPSAPGGPMIPGGKIKYKRKK